MAAFSASSPAGRQRISVHRITSARWSRYRASVASNHQGRMSAAAHASRSARASQASSRGPSGVAIGPSNSNLALGWRPIWMPLTPRRRCSPARAMTWPSSATWSFSASARLASGSLLPTHAALRADGSRHVVVRPHDPELVADAVEHAAHERVVAGPGVRRVGGRDDAALGVGGEHDRVGGRVEVEVELGSGLGREDACRADVRLVLGRDPVADVAQQLVGRRQARNHAAPRRLAHDLDGDCQPRSFGPPPTRRP